MAKSLRRPGKEAEGTFTAASGARFSIRSDRNGTWQRMERAGEVSDFRVGFVIGSGSHASGSLIQIGDHLFQSPVCYYKDRGAYDLAPGFERLSTPDFTRPVTDECVVCHSGKSMHLVGTTNRYLNPVFEEEAISCARCHGPVEQHLRRPVAGSIVNPAKLAEAARDSVCEQCHLAGVTRIPNPGKSFEDFRPGLRLEDVFTVYTHPGTGSFKVVSHVEQLALSACLGNSGGKLWCGTCHDPHAQSIGTPQHYNDRCQSCHQGALSKSHPSATGCVSCHMPRRQAQDGGHTVFTDHRIARRPKFDEQVYLSEDLVAWRDPEPALQRRNLALAYLQSGISSRSPAQIVRGYRMLTEVQRTSSSDVEVLRGIGRALLLGKESVEALRAFERVLQLVPDSANGEEDAGVASLEAGQLGKAAAHLERALTLDPLQLSAAAALQEVYRKQGLKEKGDALANRIRLAMSGRP
jgi:Flp pilus assembly protein TadD